MADADAGVIVDLRRHLGGSILAIPNGRGSCTGSQVVLELLINDKAPAAIVLQHPDVIICTGVLVAEELVGKTCSIVAVGGTHAIAHMCTRTQTPPQVHVRDEGRTPA